MQRRRSINFVLSIIFGLFISLRILSSSEHISRYHLRQLAVNGEALSVTSFSFHIAVARPPLWVGRELGQEAVFFNQSSFYSRTNGSDAAAASLDKVRLDRSRKNFERSSNHFTLPDHAIRPDCYIEMLGFARLGGVLPFHHQYGRTAGPAVGRGVLSASAGTHHHSAAQQPQKRRLEQTGQQPQPQRLRQQHHQREQQQPHHNDLEADGESTQPRGSPGRVRGGGIETTHGQPQGALNSSQIECFYRGVYSNNRIFDSKDDFWSVLVYCPMKEGTQQCVSLENMYKISPSSVSLTLSLSPHPEKWTVEMQTYRMSDYEYAAQKADAEAYGKAVSVAESAAGSKPQKERRLQLAVCTVWPYHTMYDEKVPANQALVYEFLRYYASLGIKMMVYDRDGMTMKGVLESDYARANPEQERYRGAIKRLLTYFNYTIGSTLLQQGGTVRSDTEGEDVNIIGHLDNDKSNTYDHCRFELKARYGITRVMTIDFDEFLYCKAAGPAAEEQSAYIHEHLMELEDAGFDQISFGKTTVASKVYGLGSELDCVNREVALNSARLAAVDAGMSELSWQQVVAGNSTLSAYYNYRSAFQNAASKKSLEKAVAAPAGAGIDAPGSVFNCFSSINFVEAYPNVKSIQTNHGCPYTDIHHSCDSCAIHVTDSCLRFYGHYDCICESVREFSCDFVHLSLVEAKYDHKKEELFDREEVQSLQSELYFVVNGV